MVDLSKGFDEFPGLKPTDKNEKEESGISLSSNENKAKEIELKSSLVLAEVIFQDVLRFVVSVMEKVLQGKEKEINGREILRKTEDFCKAFTTGVNSDDLMRLVAQHDEIHKNNYVYIQAVNTCLVAVHMALAMKMPIGELQELVIASLLHDIGMMKIPMDIWNKKERLNLSEEQEMHKHPLLGAEILRNIEGINETVALAVEQHQEKTDGTGYPKQLKGNEISHLARLIGLIDRYEAQTHTRPWRVRYAPDAALQQILDNEANSYDPYYMKVLLRRVSIFPVGSWVKISSGEIGNVVRTNVNSPMRPVIDIVFDRSRSRLEEPRIMDLSKQLLVHVEHCVEPESLNVL